MYSLETRIAITQRKYLARLEKSVEPVIAYGLVRQGKESDDLTQGS